jgi:hypothetical protein
MATILYRSASVPASTTTGSSSALNAPLTNAQIDQNLKNLDADISLRLLSTDAVDTNTALKVVKRDASGNFSAGTITATKLIGNVVGDIYASDGTTLVLDNGSGANAAFTGSTTGAHNGTVGASAQYDGKFTTLQASQRLTLLQSLYVDGSFGLSGQVLSSQGSNTLPPKWINLGFSALSGSATVAQGGTGITTGIVLGDIITATNSNEWGRLARGAAYQTLQMNSTGLAPVWDSIKLNQTAAVSGQLGVANGGTGAASFTSGALLKGAGSSAITVAVAGTDYLTPTSTLDATKVSGNLAGSTISSLTHYVGTTAIGLQRASAVQGLTGINSIAMPGGTSGTATIAPAAVAGTTSLTLPTASGSLVGTGDSGTVTNAMLAGSIVNGKLANSTISGIPLGNNLASLNFGSGIVTTSSSYNGSTSVDISVNPTVLAFKLDRHWIGETEIALNRASGRQHLNGIWSMIFPALTAGGLWTLKPKDLSGNYVLEMPSVNGTIVTTGDTGTVTNSMLAGSIAITKLAANAISGIQLGNNLASLTFGAGITATTSTYNGSTAVTISTNPPVLTSATTYVGTTAIPLTRTSANQALTGILDITLPGSISGSVKIIPTATAGTSVLTLPAVTGTVITSADAGTVTNNMLAGSIAVTKLVSNTISGIALGNNLAALAAGSGLTYTAGTAFNGSAASTLGVDSTVVALKSDVQYVGTTAVANNRTSANQALTGILSVSFPGSTSGTALLQATAIAGTPILNLPITTGTLIGTGDTGTVTNNMLAGSIAVAKLATSSITINGVASTLGTTVTVPPGLGSTTYPLGYATGAGSTGIQATSATTTVVMGKSCTTGQITLVNIARTNATTYAFSVTNASFAVGDHVVVDHVSGGTLGAYTVGANVTIAGTGAFYIRNIHTAALTEAPVLKFTIIRSVTA